MSIAAAQAAVPQSAHGKLSSAKNNDPKAGMTNDFMQQVLNTRQQGKEQENSPTLLSLQNEAAIHDADNSAGLVTTNQLLATAQSIESMQNQSNIGQTELTHQVSPSVPDQTVIYMLRWLASGHLSYVATDTSIVSTEHLNKFDSNPTHAVHVNSNSVQDEIISDTDNNRSLSTNIAVGNEIRKSSSNKSQDNQIRDGNAVVSLLIEQTSPYLKRRLVISHQENHTHVILRDYFLAPEQHISELKSLLVDIKQKIPGAVQLTINGHDYGDLNKYL